jgi:hypothetical protein
MAKKEKELNNAAALILTVEPAHLAAGNMQTLLKTMNFSEGDTNFAPTVEGFLDAIRQGTEALERGDMSHLEAMLYSQTETLNTLFQVSIAKAQAGEYLSQVELHTDLALKAQNQCRRTIGAIAELKEPKKATFIKQQNNAVNQQINSENNSQAESKVMEVPNGERLDGRKAQAAIGADTPVETVDFLKGAKDARREKAGIKKRN